MSVATITVALRLGVRRSIRKRLKWDDYTIILALVNMDDLDERLKLIQFSALRIRRGYTQHLSMA